MPGPWDGPVRVGRRYDFIQIGDAGWSLGGWSDSLRVESDYRSLRFEIESWARSGDRLSDLFYTRLRLSKEVQLHMWSSVLRQVVKLAGGRMDGGIVITTRVVTLAICPASTHPTSRTADSAVAALAKRQVNFDAAQIDDYMVDRTWRVDDMIEPLPHEGSGPPAEGGSWKTARRIMNEYQLADPGIVSALYDRDAELAGRDMLLRSDSPDCVSASACASAMSMRKPWNSTAGLAPVRLGVQNPGGPLRGGADALRDLEMARHRGRRVPSARGLATSNIRTFLTANWLPPSWPCPAVAVLPPNMPARPETDRGASSKPTVRRRGADLTEVGRRFWTEQMFGDGPNRVQGRAPLRGAPPLGANGLARLLTGREHDPVGPRSNQEAGSTSHRATGNDPAHRSGHR